MSAAQLDGLAALHGGMREAGILASVSTPGAREKGVVSTTPSHGSGPIKLVVVRTIGGVSTPPTPVSPLAELDIMLVGSKDVETTLLGPPAELFTAQAARTVADLERDSLALLLGWHADREERAAAPSRPRRSARTIADVSTSPSLSPTSIEPALARVAISLDVRADGGCCFDNTLLLRCQRASVAPEGPEAMEGVSTPPMLAAVGEVATSPSPDTAPAAHGLYLDTTRPRPVSP